MDTYRSSGAGGQHVNKTDSAVRMTHLPTGIVVQCQNERSQHKNRATAMKVLRSRLYDHYVEQQRAERRDLEADKRDISWGNQIRSYVFQPYTMVKDHRTKHEAGNVQAVMDGAIDPFITEFLKQARRVPRRGERRFVRRVPLAAGRRRRHADSGSHRGSVVRGRRGRIAGPVARRACRADDDVPADARAEWRVGFTELRAVGLAPENLYLSSAIPRLLRERLAPIRSAHA